MTGTWNIGGQASPVDALTPRERDILVLMADDLSNADIAERLVIAPGTIKWYVKQIYSKLDVHSREEAIARAGELNLTAPTPIQDLPPMNLPAQATTLVGRRQEIQALSQLLQRDNVRLITLIGTPGIGKTRLSLEVAQRMISQFPDGVFFVPLAPIADPDLVPDAVVKALGIQDSEQHSSDATLQNNLRRKRTLLILDNFEHVLPAASLVSNLLSEAPALKIIVTSREPLRIYGEQEYPLSTLSLPNTRDDQTVMANCEAVTLFVQRAQAVKPDFELTPDNLDTIVDICARLDALPLAIELSAARIKLYSPRALLERLEQRLSALTGGARDLPERHQTLRAAIAWSYDLISEGEKQLFRRMGVFAGGWSLAALEAVSTDPSLDPLPIDVFEGLEMLLNKSLVQQRESESGEPRFYMLETIREYALENLRESDEAAAVERAHAHFFLTQTGQLSRSMRTSDEVRAIEAFVADYDNFRAAWLHAVDHGYEDLLALASEQTYRFYIRWRWMQDGIFLHHAALQSLRNHGTLLEADLMISYAQLQSIMNSEEDKFEADYRRALEIYERHGQVRRMVAPTVSLAWIVMKRGKPDETRRILADGFRLAHESGDQASIISVQLSLALLDYELKRYDKAKAQLQSLLEIVRKAKIRSLESLMLHNLFITALEVDDFALAKTIASDYLDVVQTYKLHRMFSEAYMKVAFIAFVEGQIQEARQFSELAVKYAYSTGENLQICHSECYAGMIAAHMGDLDRTRKALSSALPLALNHEEKRYTICTAIYLAAAAGQEVTALRFIAALTHDTELPREFYYLLQPLRRELESRMSAEAYQTAWEAGSQMTVEAAFEAIDL